MRSAVAAVLCAVLLVPAACTRHTEEERVKAVIAEIAKAAEEKEIGDMLDHVARTYRDPEGRDYNGIKALLLLYFTRHERLSVYIPSVDVAHSERTAQASFEAVLTAAGGPGLRAGVLPDTLGVYRFEAVLEKQGADWKVTSAVWRRSGDSMP